MAYNETLAARVRKTLSRHKAVAEIKMFGGLCFTLHGNMCCGVLKSDLVLRVRPEDAPRYLAAPHVRPMDFTGRPMKNFLYVDPAGLKTATSLQKWIKRAADYALSLPPKA